MLKEKESDVELDMDYKFLLNIFYGDEKVIQCT